MEDKIAKLLNSSSSEKEKLHDLLNDYFYKTDEAEDLHSDSDDDSSTDNEDDAEKSNAEFDGVFQHVAAYCGEELSPDSKEEYEKAEKFRYVSPCFFLAKF